MTLRFGRVSMRQLAWVSLVVLPAFLCPAIARSTSRTYDPMWPKEVTLNSDLIVRGVTISVEDGRVPLDSIFPFMGRGGDFGVTLIGVKIRQVLKGAYPAAVVRAVLLGSRRAGGYHSGFNHDYIIGQEVIFCLRYNARIMGGVYTLRSDQRDFVKRGKVWMTREGLEEGDFPREIAYHVRATEPREMASEADAIVMGTIEAVDLYREFDCGSDIKCTADYAIVRVTAAWKGALAGEEILLRDLRALGRYPPIPSLAVGKTYLMLLKRDDVGFFPFIGFNGFLEVDGERLLANRYVQHPLSTSKMLKEIGRATR